MGALFSPDGKVMQALGRIGDLVLLNAVFLLTCIPVFTIGAASTALYTVCFRIGTEEELGLRGYFRAFRENFKQSTVLWLLLLACGFCAYFDMSLLYQTPGVLHYGFVLFAVLLLLVLLTGSYVFPLLSQFANSGRETLKNALILSLGYLPRSLLMTVLNILPAALLLTFDLLFLYAAFLWVALYFSTAAYFNALLLKKVFLPYWNEEEEKE